jgi:hypothetical protein
MRVGDCGVPEYGAGASGKESLSNTVTFSKWVAIAFAAARPPFRRRRRLA